MALPMTLQDFFACNFDIDRFLNPYLPAPPWERLPYPISYIFGYRKTPPREPGNIVVTFWAFLGVFTGLFVLEVLLQHFSDWRDHGMPLVFGAFGAVAVLEFCAIESPLAQPRNLIIGQLWSSIIGTGICKLVALSSDFERLRWLAGALACATATAVMNLTGTVHPPAGATALLAVIDDRALTLGWSLIPIVQMGCAILLLVSLILSNIQRRFPVYWWTAETLSKRKAPGCDEERAQRPHEGWWDKSNACSVAETLPGKPSSSSTVETKNSVTTSESLPDRRRTNL